MSRIITRPTKSETVQEMHWRIAVESGGGRFRGVQKGYPELGLDPLILFDDASLPINQSSTMCLKPHELNPRRVQTEIKNMRAKFATTFDHFAENACKRVFSQFAQSEAD